MTESGQWTAAHERADKTRRVVERAAEHALGFVDNGQAAFGIAGFLRKLENNELTAHLVDNWRRAFTWLLRVADELGRDRLHAEMLSLAPATA